MRNIDKIKAMSIDEMAEELNKIMNESCLYICKEYKTEQCGINCPKYIKQWLEQESEEE